MKIAALIARILLGLIFFVFGLNGFLNFLTGPLPPGLAGQYLSALTQSHYVFFISAVQLISGVLFLINRYVPLALVLSAAEIANILAFHTFMLPDPKESFMGVLVAILWLIVFVHLRRHLACLFVQRT
jgi:putative oxidoreductase